MVALLIKDYLEHYKMDYTMSVYLPEIALSGQQSNEVSKDDLYQKSGLTKGDSTDAPLLV